MSRLRSLAVLLALLWAWPADAAVARLGSSTSFAETTNSTATFSYTTTAGTNTILVVGCGWGDASTLNSVTFDGVAFTSIETPQVTNGASVTLAYLKSPHVGASLNLVVTFSASVTFTCGAAQFENVDQTTPVAGVTGAGDFTATPTVDVTCAANDMAVDTAFGSSALTVDGTQAEEWNRFDFSLPIAMSSEACAANPTTMSWSQGANWWRTKALNLKAATAGGGGAALRSLMGVGK